MSRIAVFLRDESVRPGQAQMAIVKTPERKRHIEVRALDCDGIFADGPARVRGEIFFGWLYGVAPGDHAV